MSGTRLSKGREGGAGEVGEGVGAIVQYLENVLQISQTNFAEHRFLQQPSWMPPIDILGTISSSRHNLQAPRKTHNECSIGRADCVTLHV